MKQTEDRLATDCIRPSACLGDMANPAQSKLTPAPQSAEVTRLVGFYNMVCWPVEKKKGAILASHNL